MAKKLVIEQARVARDTAQAAVKAYADKDMELGDDRMLSLKEYIDQLYEGDDEKPEQPVQDEQVKTDQPGPQGPAPKA